MFKVLRDVLMAEAVDGQAGAGAGGGVGSTVLGGDSAVSQQGGAAGSNVAAAAAANSALLGAGAAGETGDSAQGQANTQVGAAAESGANGEQSQADQAQAAVEYSDFTIPEGMTLNTELLGEFKDMAKGFGLKQEQAQALADLGVKQAQAIASQFEAQRVAETASWLEAAKTDKEFGGEKLAENLAVAKRAMDAFASPELKAVLDRTGLGNHPELIRAFVKAGKLISEDSLVAGGTQPVTKGGKTLAERLYPEQGKG